MLRVKQIDYIPSPGSNESGENKPTTARVTLTCNGTQNPPSNEYLEKTVLPSINDAIQYFSHQATIDPQHPDAILFRRRDNQPLTMLNIESYIVASINRFNRMNPHQPPAPTSALFKPAAHTASDANATPRSQAKL